MKPQYRSRLQNGRLLKISKNQTFLCIFHKISHDSVKIITESKRKNCKFVKDVRS